MKNNKYIFILLLSAFLCNSNFLYSQSRGYNWTKYKNEVTVGIGFSQFLGDLGGRDRKGTDYTPVDLELALTRPALSVGYRHKFSKSFNLFTSINYLLVAGDDKLTKEIYRNNRNLNFKSNIFEFGTRAEFSIFSRRSGSRYGVGGGFKKKRSQTISEIVPFIGIGVFYFNPKGKDPLTGNYIALKPLHTEGQGLEGGPKQYGNYSISIPFGIAYKVLIQKIWSVGVEFNYRKTFTDYIDDVSTVYYDKTALGKAYGPTSVLMADPSKGDIPGATAPNADGTGAQRGDRQKDSYAALQVTLGYYIKSKRTKTRLRSKF